MSASWNQRRTSISTLKAGVAAALLALVVALSAADGAGASRAQLTVIEDSARILAADPGVRNTSLDEIKALGAEVIKIPVQWRDVAPDGASTTKPGVDLSDPASYGGGFSVIDQAIAGARARGLKVWLMVTVPAPRWAVSRETTPQVGAYQPDPADYGEFVEALAKRYSDVDIWSALNEPNHPRYLQPQFKSGVALSAVHYRKLYQAAYAALVANGHAGDTILFGELLPRAPKPRGAKDRVPPVTWLREFFCIDGKGKPYRGAAARKHQCGGFKKIRSSGFAYHPYTMPRGPLVNDSDPNSATIYHLNRIYKVLDQAYKARRFSQRRAKIYNSEFGFQSNPPDVNFTNAGRIPSFLNISEYLSYNDSRLATYNQYLITDDMDLSAFQSGLRYADGEKKEKIYAAFQLALMVTKKTGNTAEIWGCLRTGAGTVDIQVKNGSIWETISTVNIANDLGYFRKTVSVPNASRKYFRLKSGEITSRESRPGKKIVASKR